MAVFSCTKCGHTFEQMVSNVYRRTILRRFEKCVKCDKPTYHNFVAHSGRVAARNELNDNMAVLYWRKQRDGKTASAPLDRVCKADEW